LHEIAKPKLYDTLEIWCDGDDYFIEGPSIPVLLRRTLSESPAYWQFVKNVHVGYWTSREPGLYCIHADDEEDDSPPLSDDHIADLGFSLFPFLHPLRENCLKSFQ
jgi:hypothetical protein